MLPFLALVTSVLGSSPYKVFTNLEWLYDDNAGWVQTDSQSEADLIWIRHQRHVEWDTFDGKRQWANHIANKYMIGGKGSLAKHVADYQKSHPDYHIRIPETYVLFDKNSCESFKAALEASPDALWIVKETHNSQGEGHRIGTSNMFLSVDCEDELEFARQYDRGSYAGHIAQRYVRSPLLLNGYKSEIRCYWLIVSPFATDEWIVLISPNATVRRTSTLYSESVESLSNPTVHLANIHQAEKAGAGNLEQLKWTTQSLEHYLVQQQLTTPGWANRELFPGAAHFIHDIFESVREDITNGKLEGTFGLFGVDLLFDSNLNMYLLEAQEGPGLSAMGIKKDVIPPMLRQAREFLSKLRGRIKDKKSLRSDDLELMGYQVVVNDFDQE